MTKTSRALYAALGLLALCLFVFPPTAAAGPFLAMAVVTGARATAAGQGIDANSRVIDMSDTIHLLDPNEAALTALTMKLRKARCISPKVEWLEDDYIPATTAVVTGAVTAGRTIAITATNGLYFRKGDVVQDLNTGQVFYVTVVATDTLTFAPIASSGTITAADILLVIGNANQEGATGRVLKSTTKTPQSNFTQIFRWPYGVTRTTDKSELYGGSDMAFQARKAGIEHRINMERAFLFGSKLESTDTSVGDGNTPIRFTDGLKARITSNIDQGGTITSVTTETVMSKWFRYGPARKIMLASRLTVSALNTLATNKIQTVPMTTSFPLAITEYLSPHGRLFIVTHNLLAGGSSNNNYAYAGWNFILDLDSLFYRYLQGSDTFIRPNIQANDEDGRKDEYVTECCLQVIQEKNHAIWNGVTGAA